MKVCVLTTSFPLKKGVGPGIHVVEKSRNLAKLGVEVDVLAPHHPGAPRYEVIDNVNVYRFQYFIPGSWQKLCYGAGIPTNLEDSFLARLQLPLLFISFFIRAIQLARKSDLIHAHWSLAGFVGILTGKLLRKPVVLMMHHARTNMAKGNPFVKLVLEKANYVLCNSDFTASKILEIGKPKDCKVVSPGVDVDRFKSVSGLLEFYEREPDIPKDVPLIFALGRLIQWKGFTHLIDAVGLLDQEPLPYLMIGGQGPLREQLENRAQKGGIAERVKFLGYIPNKYTPLYYSVADVFVLPSIIDKQGNTEGLGVVLLESMACETPCVASNVGGITDIVIDGVNGFLVEPGNSRQIANRLSQIITDENIRESMGKQGRLMVEERFSWQAQASKILEVYRELVK